VARRIRDASKNRVIALWCNGRSLGLPVISNDSIFNFRMSSNRPGNGSASAPDSFIFEPVARSAVQNRESEVKSVAWPTGNLLARSFSADRQCRLPELDIFSRAPSFNSEYFSTNGLPFVLRPPNQFHRLAHRDTTAKFFGDIVRRRFRLGQRIANRYGHAGTRQWTEINDVVAHETRFRPAQLFLRQQLLNRRRLARRVSLCTRKLSWRKRVSWATTSLISVH